jgi:chromosome segregation ATPase
MVKLELNNLDNLDSSDIKIGVKALIEELQKIQEDNKELVEEIEKLQEDNKELADYQVMANKEIEKLEDETEILKDKIAIYKSKFNNSEDEIMKQRDNYAKLELKYSNQKDDIDSLIKENNHLNRVKEDLEEKIDKLNKNMTNQQKEWLNKERNLLSDIRESKSDNRELKRKSLFLDMQLQEAISELPEKSDITGLKSRINKHEKTINDLNDELDIAKNLIEQKDDKEKELSNEISSLKALIKELEESNNNLTEENESYQILLQEKTLSGELMQYPILQAFDKVTDSDLSVNESTISEQSKDATLCDELSNVQNLSVFDKDPKIVKYENEIKKVKEENKALIVFVRNVIQKMMSDPHLEEVEDSSRVGHRPIPPKPTKHSRSQSISYLTKPFSFFSH